MVLLDFSSLSISLSISLLRGAGHTGYNFYSLIQQALNWHLSWTLGDLTPLHNASVTVVLDNKKTLKVVSGDGILAGSSLARSDTIFNVFVIHHDNNLIISPSVPVCQGLKLT
jgi:hypothetical protein